DSKEKILPITGHRSPTTDHRSPATARMPYELFIALRYLRAKRKQVMISVITIIAIAAVAMGVASLIVVLAMMTGFRQEFQAKILSGTAHLNLRHKEGQPIENYRELVSRLSSL